MLCLCSNFFFQAEDGIRDLVRSRGLGDVYKRQAMRAGQELLQAEPDHSEHYAFVAALHFDCGRIQDLSLIHI